MPLKIVEVHNVWTLYERPDPEASRFAAASRPQDWGDKQQWHYERFCFEWIFELVRYINHAHCWTDIKMEHRGEYPMLFASIIVHIAQPGENPKLCGMDYLDEDDFWSDDWRQMPPYYNPDEDESVSI